MDYVALLKKHKLDEAKFARVDEGWQKRMSDQSDPMAGAELDVSAAGRAVDDMPGGVFNTEWRPERSSDSGPEHFSVDAGEGNLIYSDT